MARLQKLVNPEISKYRDRRFDGNQEEFERTLRESTTVYVGNLSFFTTEEQIYEVFSKAGDIKRIVMGLDKVRHTPCGFCFVVYYTRADTEDCVKYINGMALDERLIRVDFDWGFRDGRQFGRGKSGGQVRDEYRMDHDEGRGGFGHIKRQALEARLAALQHQQRMYGEGQDAEDDATDPAAAMDAVPTAAAAGTATGNDGDSQPAVKRRRRDSDQDDDD